MKLPIRAIAAAVCCATLVMPLAFGNTAPSFNCRKASTVPEKAICGDAELSGLDAQLARAWGNLKHGFNDNGVLGRMTLDQRQWVSKRDACGADRACLRQAYKDRLARLTGADPGFPAAGVYAAARIGDIAVYPEGRVYLVSIMTAAPEDGRWVCEVAGTATLNGATLRITPSDDPTRSISAVLHEGGTLVIDSGDEVLKPSSLTVDLTARLPSRLGGRPRDRSVAVTADTGIESI